ncbi:hypothetical protein X805_30860 [Sphaerotilus natans subsp. natans DSM 6575]|uniref:Uncharacterized protein n=1 Tax=Sphaerotilus natans subsp. natans DSM 6575 TaxID=1286631 RepID=A0A059KIW0_9BURK|nr:hypothetical protein [Sphaerotilus natans]KDB51320.1 hypothetical protein X805_30860 [Sphaerotilus natans subsp. natans DSM 6575]SIQ84836.1 hypothetical protein SAMN05421778_10546 [Sphaerotilus natans]
MSNDTKTPNGRGGARPGAGRLPRQPEPLPHIGVRPQDDGAAEAVEFLRAVMRDTGADGRLRVDAAKALLRAGSSRETEGKKAQRQAGALTAHEGTGWDGLLPQ